MLTSNRDKSWHIVKVRWPENLGRAGKGMWVEALNFLDLLLRFGSSQNEGQSGKTQMKFILFFFLLIVSTNILVAQQNNDKPETSFEFVFLTDIHLKPEMDAPIGFQMAIDKVNELNPDFVLTGGDLVYDVMRGNKARGDSLFTLFSEMEKGFKMPLFHCVGNHDLFGIYEESPEDSTHADYKYGMFERYFGETYYSFNHKGWHFIVLNSLDVTPNKRYKGIFHKEQMEWLKKDIQNLDKTTPIVLTTHLPMISTFSQVRGKTGRPNVSNSADVFRLLEDHNLKLILQGHVHWKEYGFVNDKFHYITGGSIAGNGWKGRRHNTKEGFVLIKVNGDDFTWEYIDHGWEEKRLQKNIQ